MAIEDKDFIIRQVKQFARGLGMMLSKNSLRELINYEQSETNALSDEELESIILLADVNDKLKKEHLSEKEIAERFGMKLEEWQNLVNGSRLPTNDENKMLTDYLLS